MSLRIALVDSWMKIDNMFKSIIELSFTLCVFHSHKKIHVYLQLIICYSIIVMMVTTQALFYKIVSFLAAGKHPLDDNSKLKENASHRLIMIFFSFFFYFSSNRCPISTLSLSSTVGRYARLHISHAYRLTFASLPTCNFIQCVIVCCDGMKLYSYNCPSVY